MLQTVFFGHAATVPAVGVLAMRRLPIRWKEGLPRRRKIYFSMEPGIHLPGKPGIRRAELMVATGKRYSLPNHVPKEFAIIA